MNNNIEFKNHGDATVIVHQHDHGGAEIALKVIQALFGLVMLLITSPITVPWLLIEMRKENARLQKQQNLLEGGE